MYNYNYFSNIHIKLVQNIFTKIKQPSTIAIYNFMFRSENAFNGFKTFAQLNLQLQLQLK